ncbi:unnamed protein product [Didymodactylos carnosus]|uniref:Uncharacterized protein n=1 Tax=Didymodactylos carnosus TaxID=1234261 RepID=A0A815BFJ1_9BILA|nr:unnamed protein product [Didymodactylos carnosus]CAF4056434.1 unnamed protein product [Didymodactylos carnosus]
MGGLGSRFQTEGYRFPKPLINIVGRPMLFFLLDRLKLEPEDKLFIALSQGIEDEFQVGAQIKKMDSVDLSRKTISLDCDTIYFSDILGTFRASESSCCFYFEDRGTKPVFSYLDMSEDNVVHAVKEKVPISTHANTGAYGFSSGNSLLSSCIRVLDVGVDTSGEYYISSVITQMLSEGAVMADVALVTFDNMKKFGIPYDEVYFGKPWADVYVDDKAVHAMLDTEKIAGEVYFYEHMPKEIKHFFPHITESVKNEATSTYTITMDKIEGVTFSHLATSRCLTKGRFIKLLEALRFIHSSQASLEGDEKLTEMKTACIYANGASKVRVRLQQHKALYEQLDSDVDLTVKGILNSLDAYEQADAGVRAAVVHGDPVFSNVLLEKGGEIRLIDMRGMLGDVVTTCGDALYDIAKVFQSLCGYDFVLLDLPMASKDVEILAELKEILRSFVQAHYNIRTFRDVEILTASLFFSLIPLHDRPNHQKAFYSMARGLIFPLETLNHAKNLTKSRYGSGDQ